MQKSTIKKTIVDPYFRLGLLDVDFVLSLISRVERPICFANKPQLFLLIIFYFNFLFNPDLFNNKFLFLHNLSASFSVYFI